ncbi:hypothetical protein BHU72_11855 [Desulfuribacillus stibiiarsenatis]|uniref:Uncharacterized protein n=1 Tax=Desulfuribacillus stibiiarsenatis TaxID=1390249 RepID=A0A1E5L8F0_9FIRM|nr:hypothetical protein [Desulfuribacillus stibiiarsenatis]OEH86223.1 hypothetical protein BHU72_11855 [Desulfuribacillus stibiiarsenatis]
MSEYNVVKSVQGQKTLCKERQLPHFAPSDGRCWSCKRNIYETKENKMRNWQTGEITGTYLTGITVEQASKELVTGCPHCSRSYCD